jgi:hypothetical protein
MLGAKQQAVEVSLLKPDAPGIGTAARRARGGLRNPRLHKGPLSVGWTAHESRPRRQGQAQCCHARQTRVRERSLPIAYA